MRVYVCEVYDHKEERAICRGIDLDECCGDAYDMCMKTMGKFRTSEIEPSSSEFRYEFFCTEDSIDFQWRMDDEGYRKFHHDTDPRDCEDWCGSVYFGKYSLEFMHITDNVRYYNLFVLDQKGYGQLIDGTPYDECAEIFAVDIPRRRTLVGFQNAIDQRIFGLIKRNPHMIQDAVSATEPERWFPRADGTYYKPTITRRA